MNPFIIMIIEAVLEVLKKCPEPPASKRKILRKPHLRHKLIVAMRVRGKLKGDAFEKAWKEATALAAGSTDAELDALMDQAA